MMDLRTELDALIQHSGNELAGVVQQVVKQVQTQEEICQPHLTEHISWLESGMTDLKSPNRMVAALGTFKPLEPQRSTSKLQTLEDDESQRDLHNLFAHLTVG